MAKKRAEFFIKYAQVIRVPTTLRKLHEGKFDHDKLEEICTNLADQPAQCLSARFLGENEETLFVYFGRRVVTANSVPPVRFLDLMTCVQHLISHLSETHRFERSIFGAYSGPLRCSIKGEGFKIGL